MSSSRTFERSFEGAQALSTLLAEAGSAYGADEVVAAFRAAQADGASAQEVIPALFEQEPRFRDPAHAQALFQNLLGLWDLLESGAGLPVVAERPRRVKRPPPPPAPGGFGPTGPDAPFVEAARRHLAGLDKRALDRLQHGFENRQDALLVALEEQGLSDGGFLCAQHLLFELFAMIELGWEKGTRSAQLSAGAAVEAPGALLAYVDEALAAAKEEARAGLPEAEAGRVREVVRQGLGALWAARR